MRFSNFACGEMIKKFFNHLIPNSAALGFHLFTRNCSFFYFHSIFPLISAVKCLLFSRQNSGHIDIKLLLLTKQHIQYSNDNITTKSLCDQTSKIVALDISLYKE